jgi:hypothetical protein
MKPIVDGLAETYGERVAFQRLDANRPAGRAALQFYGLRGHPAFVVLDRDGKMRWSGLGEVPTQTLIVQLEKVLEPRE